MHKLTNYRKAYIAFALAIGIIASIALFQSIARADISNPHPTPPAGSVTNAIIAPNTILDSNISPAAAINTEKLAGGSTIGAAAVSDGVGIETTSLLKISTSTNTITATASTTINATTTLDATAAHPVVLNTVPVSFPSTQCGNGAVWTNNGAGALFCNVPSTKIGTTTPNTVTHNNGGSSGVTTLTSTTVPANSLGTSNTVMFQIPMQLSYSNGCGSAGSATVDVTYGGVDLGTVTYTYNAGGSQYGYLSGYITANAATNSEVSELHEFFPANQTSTITGTLTGYAWQSAGENTIGVDDTQSQNLVVTANVASGGGSCPSSVIAYTGNVWVIK